MVRFSDATPDRTCKDCRRAWKTCLVPPTYLYKTVCTKFLTTRNLTIIVFFFFLKKKKKTRFYQVAKCKTVRHLVQSA